MDDIIRDFVLIGKSMQILFYDVATPRIYTDQTRIETGLGGTEATITRVAHALSDTYHIIVAQHCRTPSEDTESHGVRYLSLESANQLSPDIVVLLRKRDWLERITTLFPKAKRFFWMHNMPSKELYKARRVFAAGNYEIIAVSDFHQKKIQHRLNGQWQQKLFHPFLLKFKTPHIHRLYNPIDDNLEKNNTPWQPNKMILASSPYKGLQQNLAAFEKILTVFPEYHLCIATYAPWDQQQKLPRNTTFLGSIPQQQLMQHIRESFCMFYPQYQRVETFGLVYAEANALGTPVIAHDFGAAREVLSDPDQLIDGRNIDSIIEKIKAWRIQRPNISANPMFRLNHVKQTWIDLFEKT